MIERSDDYIQGWQDRRKAITARRKMLKGSPTGTATRFIGVVGGIISIFMIYAMFKNQEWFILAFLWMPLGLMLLAPFAARDEVKTYNEGVRELEELGIDP